MSKRRTSNREQSGGSALSSSVRSATTVKNARAPSSSTLEDARSLVALAIALVESGLAVLTEHLPDAQLQHESALIPGGTLGKHFRHVAETYGAFLGALRADPYDAVGTPQIDYNAVQPQGRRQVALEVAECREALTQIRAGLADLADMPDLDVVFQFPVDVIAITPTRQEMQSTLGRELWFCSLHAIHHYTMVRVIAVYELGLDLPIEFGTAPATIHYRGKGWKPPTVSSPPSLKAKL